MSAVETKPERLDGWNRPPVIVPEGEGDLLELAMGPHHPSTHGVFRMDQPFMTLPNVIGSPHNSAAAISGTGTVGLQRAIANIKRALAGVTPLYQVPPEDRMM